MYHSITCITVCKHHSITCITVSKHVSHKSKNTTEDDGKGRAGKDPKCWISYIFRIPGKMSKETELQINILWPTEYRPVVLQIQWQWQEREISGENEENWELSWKRSLGRRVTDQFEVGNWHFAPREREREITVINSGEKLSGRWQGGKL